VVTAAVDIKLLGLCNVITYEMTYCACADLILVVPEMSPRDYDLVAPCRRHVSMQYLRGDLNERIEQEQGTEMYVGAIDIKLKKN
jgi:hypothetical protein